ncbi:TetR/AcrR family transcriptional regulator [Mycobacterium sp. THU-M116]
MAQRTLRADAFDSITRILAAARTVFAAEDGSGAFKRIATEAGVGIATVYRHFPTREALAQAVYDNLFTTEIAPLISEFERSDTPREVLLDMAENLLTVLDRQRGLVLSLGNMAHVTAELFTRNIDTIGPAVTRAQHAGTLRPDLRGTDIPPLFAMVVSGLQGIHLDHPTRRRYLSLLLDGLNPTNAQPLP